MDYRRCTKKNSPDALPQKCRLPVVPKHLYYSTYILSTPITAAGVERANSTLRFVTNVYRSQMTEDRLNSFLLLYVHKDVVLNYDNIIDMSMQLKILDGCFLPIHLLRNINQFLTKCIGLIFCTTVCSVMC